MTLASGLGQRRAGSGSRQSGIEQATRQQHAMATLHEGAALPLLVRMVPCSPPPPMAPASIA